MDVSELRQRIHEQLVAIEENTILTSASMEVLRRGRAADPVKLAADCQGFQAATLNATLELRQLLRIPVMPEDKKG